MTKFPIFMENIYVPLRLFFENHIINFSNNKDISQINENLFIGNISTATNRDILKEKGITHIIDILSHKFEPFPKDFEYLFIQKYDTLDSDLTFSLPISNLFIRDAIKKGGKVYVHCMEGISRSVSIVLAYMMTLSEDSIDNLLGEIQDVRPIAQPNTSFMTQLFHFRDNVHYNNAIKELYYNSHLAYIRPPPINPYFIQDNNE